jgi:hypothetical protein
MAHYAFIDDENVVTEVIVGNDETTGDWETLYAAVRGQRCLRTSYRTHANQHPSGTPYRGNYAGIGYTYSEELDAFVPPCPGDGWTLDVATCRWVEAA